jgi:hypothetical protein
MLRLLLFLILLIIRKDVETMAMIYASLIIKGYKTYAEVPSTLKEQVAEILRQLDCEHLIVE